MFGLIRTFSEYVFQFFKTEPAVYETLPDQDPCASSLGGRHLSSQTRWSYGHASVTRYPQFHSTLFINLRPFLLLTHYIHSQDLRVACVHNPTLSLIQQGVEAAVGNKM